MLVLAGNGGGTASLVSVLAFGGGSILFSAHGNTFIAAFFCALIAVSFSLTAAMLIRFSINFKRHGHELRCPRVHNRFFHP